ncbi:hypothetical protein LEM8419_03345 [Neolewinella maritima]|uniref:3-keto-alpha-glucoside-1,2-lyase/3-keto-2-hydroxy-glucal hydratase domain-containing protein n=1 Tax=Neolewinella maritima TaxID=1383882 RepID=A0ABM9B669_9BACT|nr:DUF1080 domain-containing protein [Neolewinella maritima]CAH1002466.1 hypothetical protein LEM8419_03345 [Neolewinella maritima]
MIGPHLLVVLLLFTTPAFAQTDRTPLLTDAALTGWHIIVRDQGPIPTADQPYFVWEDSLLHVLGTPEAGSAQPFAALVSDSSYTRYRLHIEYKWGEKKFAPRTEAVRDAGVLFHVFDTTIFWPSSLECQIQEGDTGDAWLIGTRATSRRGQGNDFAPDGAEQIRTGERYVRFTRSASYEQPGWNTIELEVDGPTASFYVNGHHVNTITDTRRPGSTDDQWIPLTAGPIGLQAEGAEVYYRNVWIEAL